MILDSDKNLGPCILERKSYIQSILKQHLLNKDNYARLTNIEASNLMEEFISEVSELIKFEHNNDLTEAERTFFSRGYEKMHRIPQLYGNPKVRKKWSLQVPLRPVNSQVGSFSTVASKYVDYYLRN